MGNRHKSLKTVPLVAAALAALPFGTAGCKTFERSYGARPIVTFEDLGSGRDDCDTSDYRIAPMDEQGGRFPTSLAVVEVSVANTECLPDEPRLQFVEVPEWERPPWLECLEDIPQVSEIFFLQGSDFPRRTIRLEEMARTAGGYRARLCLVYARSDLERDAARVIGVLIDTRTGRILATLASRQEEAILRGFEPDRPLDRPEGDDRHLSPRYHAAEGFRRLLHDCVLELAERQEVVSVARLEPHETSE